MCIKGDCSIDMISQYNINLFPSIYKALLSFVLFYLSSIFPTGFGVELYDFLTKSYLVTNHSCQSKHPLPDPRVETQKSIENVYINSTYFFFFFFRIKAIFYISSNKEGVNSAVIQTLRIHAVNFRKLVTVKKRRLK